jgi:hypothetical protein
VTLLVAQPAKKTLAATVAKPKRVKGVLEMIMLIPFSQNECTPNLPGQARPDRPAPFSHCKYLYKGPFKTLFY